MGCEMGNGNQQSCDLVPENLRKQLAVAVRSVQWSYAIFWSLSTTKHGVLAWGEGYYNGDIKTRKTVQAMELKADKVGLLRSEQLRELFESLSEDETDQQAKRPSVALSPEDLTDAEWYYLVCMSFVFSPGEGMPGRSFENGQTIWLCNAQHADSKVFSRSLLAKSASIQTVVCFPYLGGVIELGITELVPEDLSLLQHIKASLLEFSKPICSDKYPVPHNSDDDKDPMCTKADHEIIDTVIMENFCSPAEAIKFEEDGIRDLHANVNDESYMDSLDECSNGCEHNYQTEDSFMHEGINGVASQVQSWHFMDDDFSNGVQDSMNSSDCISEAFVNQEKALGHSTVENVKQLHLKELQDCNHTKLSSLNIRGKDELHYKNVLTAIFRSSHGLIKNPGFHNYDCKTSFVSWKKVGRDVGHRKQVQQKMLKKILFTIPLMHSSSLKSGKEKGREDLHVKLESEENFFGYVLSAKKRENENYLVLKSMVPSVSEIDKASILNDTIKYLKELEARVEELESCMDTGEFEAGARRKYTEMNEQISDNYDNEKTDNVKKLWLNKRKASDIDETNPELNKVVPKDGQPLDLKVSLKEHEVLIEMRCSYREYLLLDIMDAINNLHLDAHSVQSTTLDDVLTLTLKAKFRGTAVAPAGMIQQALLKICGKS